jgi:hypothetical protein
MNHNIEPQFRILKKYKPFKPTNRQTHLTEYYIIQELKPSWDFFLGFIPYGNSYKWCDVTYSNDTEREFYYLSAAEEWIRNEWAIRELVIPEPEIVMTFKYGEREQLNNALAKCSDKAISIAIKRMEPKKSTKNF